MIWLVGLVLVAFGVIAFLAVWIGQAQQRLAVLETEIARLGRDLAAEDREFENLMAEVGGSRVVVELTHPMMLAREHSRWAGALTGVAPRLIRRRVYDQAASEMKQVLAARGVAAEVQVFHPTGA